MGGNIFESNRLDKQAYLDLKVGLFRQLVGLGLKGFDVIKSYYSKEDFGDMDILVLDTPANREMLEGFVVNCQDSSKNSNVWSVLYNNFQVDFILTDESHYDFSLNYFSWNDLGNLVGRVARKIGLKFGHNGLFYVLRDGTNKVADVLVTNDFEEALEILDYSYERFDSGFKTPEDIYEFVATSGFFDPESFSLETRSHNARVRDRKRKMYRGFLEWMENRTTKPGSQVDHCDKNTGVSRAMIASRSFTDRLVKVVSEHRQAKVISNKLDGKLVMRLTGLEGKELGAFMRFMKSHLQPFTEWLERATGKEVRDIILGTYGFYRMLNEEEMGSNEQQKT